MMDTHAAARHVIEAYRECVNSRYADFWGDIHLLRELVPSIFADLEHAGLAVELDHGEACGVRYNGLGITNGAASAYIQQMEWEDEQVLQVEHTIGGRLEDVTCSRVPIPAEWA